MAFILALTPIIVILFLMVGLRWGAARAGAAGYLCALLVAVIFFGAGPILLAYAHSKALLMTIDVLMIIWAAFLLYRVADEAGAIKTIGRALPHLTGDRGMQALIIGWVFASFLQGVGGFGVPVAVVAPVLVGLGFTPLNAVMIPSIGHTWGITFGSLGSSFQALMAVTGLPAEMLSPISAVFLSLSGLTGGFLVVHAAAGWRAVYRLALPVIILGGVMGIVHYFVVISGFWNIGTFIAGISGLLVVFPLARHYPGESGDKGDLDLRALFVAIAGYVGLFLVIMGVQFVKPLYTWLGQITISMNFPETSTSNGLLQLASFITPAGFGRKITLFRHTGSLLFYAAILASLIYKKAGLYQKGALTRIVEGTIRRVLSPSVSIASMVTMAVIMEHAGMTDTLARGLSEGVRGFFPAVAPWIGALGAFMTGSNTNSNVVFGALQLKTAQLLGFNVSVILAGQTAGAALASVVAPTKVVVGTCTVGMVGKEGEVMRHLLIYIIFQVSLISVMTVIGVLFK